METNSWVLTWMEPAERLRRLGRELLARFEVMDRLVLGPVVHEDPLHLSPEADREDIDQKEDETDPPVDQVVQEPLADAGQMGILASDRLRGEPGDAVRRRDRALAGTVRRNLGQRLPDRTG